MTQSKNCWLIPTDKPSRLMLRHGILFFFKDDDSIPKGTAKNQNIYITNSEEIKESQVLNKTDYYYVKNHYNEWYVGKFNGVSFDFINDNGNFHSNLFVCKKIILTTDQDLIKDGVQAIDDEFLEWFVKNPSCEEVEVEEFEPIYGHQNNSSSILYKIIIPSEEPKLKNICIKCGVDLYATEGRFECQKHPKECKGIYLSKETLLIHAAEQKQHIIDMMKADEELGLYEETVEENFYEQLVKYFETTPREKILEDWEKSAKFDSISPTVEEFLDNTEETLEEAAESRFGTDMDSIRGSSVYDLNTDLKRGFIEGAKWMQERSYSEEDMRKAIQETITLMRYKATEFREHENTVIEQFKK